MRALPGSIAGGADFLIVNLAWVFFRADDLSAASRYLSSLFNLGGGSTANALLLRAIFYEPGHVIVMIVAARHCLLRRSGLGPLPQRDTAPGHAGPDRARLVGCCHERAILQSVSLFPILAMTVLSQSQPSAQECTRTAAIFNDRAEDRRFPCLWSSSH